LNIKEIVKTEAVNRGMSMCGVAGIDRFNSSPPGRHPTDILPGCKSVIVIGVRILDGIVQANFRALKMAAAT
jgi:epoxyqueuosine reductase QueG